MDENQIDNSLINITFEDLFNFDDIQRLQDQFSRATGVASIITRVDGVPITRPSNFCSLCRDIIRKTEKGLANCYKSDAAIGKRNIQGPTIQTCMSGGLWDAGAGIFVGKKHLANWLIGQVRDETQTEEKMLDYCRKIGADEKEFLVAFREVPTMTKEHFTDIAQMLHTMANQLSSSAYQNVQQSHLINKLEQSRHELFTKQEQLIQSKEMFHALFEQAGGYCMILDPNTPDGIPLIIDANKAACAAHGFTREEFIGRYVSDIEDENGKRSVKKRTAEIMTGEPFYAENIHVRKDGTTFTVAVNAKRIDIEKRRSLILTTGYDISERKRAEKQLRESQDRFELAMEAVNDGLYDWNLRANEIYYSPGWKRMLGYQADELPNDFSVWEKLTEPEDVRKSWEMQQELVNGKRDRFEMEFKMKHKNGHWVDILSRATAVFDMDGKAVRIVGTHVDISERKRLEANLLQAQKIEAIGTLAGGIAHDFNNILMAILGYAELAREDSPAGSMVRKYIDEVVKASHKAKELVKQILAFSRQTEAEHIPLRPAVIIKEVFNMLRPSLPATIDIQQDIDPEVGLIFADPTQMHQIMVNLCTNAFHAMEEKGGILTISLKKKTLSRLDLANEPRVQPGDFVQLSISDTGAGIAPEIRKKIFDPYFTTKEVGKGTGLGLAIIHGIVKSYKGFVTCHSKPGEGTTFRVYLPVISDPTLQEVEMAPLHRPQLCNERILYIDDENILAEMSKTMLERLGYRVTVETNSIEALRIIQSQPDRFDLVITDQTMPGMTGIDLARRILQIRPKLPIILCTGFSNLISEEKARMCGIKGFAMKPLARKDLATLIRKVLEAEK
jgi:PAS domain S-box-containing protein